MARKYTKEFKNKVCDLIEEEGLKVAVVAEKFGLNKIMVYKWLDDRRTYGQEAFVGKGNQRSSDAELRKLKKENEYLKMENEILKKAAAYFAKNPENE